MGLCVATLLLGGCGGTQAPPRPAGEPYAGYLVQLFDDTIAPASVGLSLGGTSPASDPLLRPRAQHADIVARLRVQPVTRDRGGPKVQYVLNVQVGVPPLIPSEVTKRHFELVINQQNNSFGLVESLEMRLRGKTFIGFVKSFAGAHRSEIHWHLTADTAEVAQVVQEIAVLEELAGQEAP